MPYRNPMTPRQASQTNEIMKYAGVTATWRQYVSASAGISVAGFGSGMYYREQTITAMLGGNNASLVSPNIQRQTTMGQLPEGTLRIVSREVMTDKDEIIWRGVRYRVDANSQRSPLNGYWMSIITRGDS